MKKIFLKGCVCVLFAWLFSCTPQSLDTPLELVACCGDDGDMPPPPPPPPGSTKG